MGALKDIIAITGHGTLFKFVSQGRNSVIVESIEDGKRMNATATSKLSTLEDISIFTDDKEVSLETVFKAIFDKEQGKETIDAKSSNAELTKLFEQILPNYDRDRVYVSDIKKVVKWYNLLIQYNLLVFSEEEKSVEETK